MKANSLIYFISNVLILIPIYSKRKQIFINNTYFKCYAIFHAVVIVLAQVICVTKILISHRRGLEQTFSVTQVAIFLLGNIVALFQSLISTICCAFYDIPKWELFFKQYQDVDMSLKLKYKLKYHKRNRVISTISTVILVLLILLNNWNWSVTHGFYYQLKYYSLYYLMFVEHIRMMLEFLIIGNIKKQYETLRVILEENFTTLNSSNCLKSFGILYRKLYDLVHLFNTNLNRQMSLGVIQAFFLALYYINNVVLLFTHQEDASHCSWIFALGLGMAVLVRFKKN